MVSSTNWRLDNMARWQKPKPTKSEKQAAKGQEFMFLIHDDRDAPWAIDDANYRDAGLYDDIQPKQNVASWEPPPPPEDEIPF